MAQPSTLVAWATDANIATGAETGSPTKVDPGAPYVAQGGVPGAQFVAPYWNYVVNNHYQWLAYLADLDTDAYFLGQTYTWTATHTFAATTHGGVATHNALGNFTALSRHSGIQLVTGGNVVYTDSAGAAAPRATTKFLPLAVQVGPTYAAGTWAVNVFGNGELSAVGAAADGFMWIDLPSGTVLTRVYVGLTDGAAQPLVWTVERETPNIASGVTTYAALGGGAVTSAGSAAFQNTSTAAFTETIANGNCRYRIKFAASAAGIKIHHVYVTFNDIGFSGNG
jgi:hypothetical protein